MSVSQPNERGNFHRERSIDDLFLENIPPELSRFVQWVVYKFGPLKPNGKRDKIPLNPLTGSLAAVDDFKTWGTRGEAISAYLGGMGDGLGFVFTAHDPYVGIDLDGCRDPQTGQPEPWAMDIVQRIDSYTEASPSGTGVHILSKGKLPGGGGKKDHVEMYETGRFFTMTGEHISTTPTTIEERQEPITALFREHFPHKMNGNGAHTGTRTHAQMSEEERQRTLADLRLALPHIPAIEHDMWLQVGMGLHHVDSSDVGFDMWVEWSKSCPEKFDADECAKRWRSFHDDGGITHKSIFAWAIEHGWTQASTGEDGEEPSLPSIIVNNEHLRDVVDHALDAVQKRNDPPSLFVRGGLITRVQHDEQGQRVIVPLTEAALKERLSRDANFYRRTQRKKAWSETKVSPPRDVVESLLVLPALPFPALLGLCACPVLRPDGTILDQPGYDTITKLLYEPAPGLTLPPMPTTPTQADAQAAREFLCTELLGDFPFCEPADTANMLALLLTPIVRPAITGGVPLCLLDKPSPGSGATLLADAVATIATGEHAAKQMMPTGKQSEEEMRKKITSLLMGAQSVIVFDNIEWALASNALQIVLTTPFWGDRPLGGNKDVRLPVRVTWIATANNIQIRGDLARRSYRVRIDAKQDRPWTRNTFRHANLLAWARKNRGELLACLLTMARGWFANGKPPPQTQSPTIGGFEEWTAMVSGILSYAGVHDVLTNLEELYAQVDQDAEQWSIFIQTWHEQLGDKVLTVADLATSLHDVEALKEALPDSLEWDTEKLTSSKQRLGYALKKRKDRFFGEYRLEQDAKDAHSRKVCWRVRHSAPTL